MRDAFKSSMITTQMCFNLQSDVLYCCISCCFLFVSCCISTFLSQDLATLRCKQHRQADAAELLEELAQKAPPHPATFINLGTVPRPWGATRGVPVPWGWWVRHGTPVDRTWFLGFVGLCCGFCSSCLGDLFRLGLGEVVLAGGHAQHQDRKRRGNFLEGS